MGRRQGRRLGFTGAEVAILNKMVKGHMEYSVTRIMALTLSEKRNTLFDYKLIKRYRYSILSNK